MNYIILDPSQYNRNGVFDIFLSSEVKIIINKCMTTQLNTNINNNYKLDLNNLFTFPSNSTKFKKQKLKEKTVFV